ncbi:MAG: hypothetical protein RL693_2841 [Verrucomicrobiota bacterium]|jgi:hypothetical protein
MNLYRIFKGLDQVVKDVPKLKKSVQTLTSQNKSIQAKLTRLTKPSNSDFQSKWPHGDFVIPAPLGSTKSSICKQADFLNDHHRYWCSVIKEEPVFHRKQWEFVYILESLKQRGMIAEGKRGLGFAVGTEPLPAAFASFGCEIVATDINPDEGTEKGWTPGNQLCFGLQDLNKRGVCPADKFNELCSYRPVDMNAIPDDLRDFDFNWSSCSFEHLGSIERGLAFVRNQLKTLKSGGWAVHTTEYNLSSNDETLEDPNCVAFRQQDIEKVVAQLRADGHFVEPLDYSTGWLPYDYKVDTPPYSLNPHLRLQLSKFICTSIGLIIRKK